MDWENWLTPVLIVAALAMVGAVFRIGKWVGSIDSLKETVETSIMEIKNDIKKILERLPPSTIAEGSPLTLTELGRLVSKELKAGEWAQETANELILRVQKKEPYEVQQFCFDYVKEGRFISSDEFVREMRKIAYNHAVSIEKVEDVLAIELRDALMNHPTHPREVASSVL